MWCEEILNSEEHAKPGRFAWFSNTFVTMDKALVHPLLHDKTDPSQRGLGCCG
jgi:hypothetical protein